MNQTLAFPGTWIPGHFAYEAGAFHTDRRFNCHGDQHRETLDAAVLEALVAANPEIILEKLYGDEFSWVERVLSKLETGVGHEVSHIKVPPYTVPFSERTEGRTVIFIETLSLGVDQKGLLTMARDLMLRPVRIVTLLDRSAHGGIGSLQGLPVTAVYREPTNIWPEDDCPLCANGQEIDLEHLARG